MTQKHKKVNKFHFLKCWMFFFQGLKASPDSLNVLYGGLDQKRFFLKFQLYFFLQFLVIETLYPDLILIRIHLKCWIRIWIQWIRILHTAPNLSYNFLVIDR